MLITENISTKIFHTSWINLIYVIQPIDVIFKTSVMENFKYVLLLWNIMNTFLIYFFYWHLEKEVMLVRSVLLSYIFVL